MPRPRTLSDDAVLDATLELVTQHGPSHVTLARVGTAVGLAPATLVQRFGTKRGLLLAAARRGGPGRDDLLEQVRAEHDSRPLATLYGLLTSLASTVGTREAMANSLAFLHLDLSDPEFHQLALEGMQRMREQIRDLLDEAFETGELVAGDTQALARAVQNTYNGALITWAIYGEGTVEAWLRRELDFLLRPYRS
jgi:AcrR family transcriptional regulator